MSKYAEVSKGEGGPSNQQQQDGGRDAEAGYGFGPIGPSLYEYNDRPRRDLCGFQYFLSLRSLITALPWLFSFCTGAMIAYLIVVGLATIGGIAVFAGTDSDALKGKYSTSFYQNRRALPQG